MPSSGIRVFAYDTASRTLAVAFASGQRYRFHEAPPATREAMPAALDKGEFLNTEIHDRFRYTAED